MIHNFAKDCNEMITSKDMMSFAGCPSSALCKCPNHLSLFSLAFAVMIDTPSSFLILSFLFMSLKDTPIR